MEKNLQQFHYKLVNYDMLYFVASQEINDVEIETERKKTGRREIIRFRIDIGEDRNAFCLNVNDFYKLVNNILNNKTAIIGWDRRCCLATVIDIDFNSQMEKQPTIEKTHIPLMDKG